MPGTRKPRDDTTAQGVDDAPLAATGVANPYALAEAVVGHAIDWAAVASPERMLEEVLRTPYEQLFDPKHGSPLYVDQHVDEKGNVVRSAPTFTDVPSGNDAERPDLADLTGARTLAELVRMLTPDEAERIPVRSVVQRDGGALVDLGEGPSVHQRRMSEIFRPDLREVFFPLFKLGYHPANCSWTDVGRFYDEAAEFFDPVQGGVGDCYVIAAMSSVAWAMPWTIVDRSRATSPNNQQFVHRIGFTGGNGLEEVEVTDSILTPSGSTSPLYARSVEPGEIWPAVYEKAYAKWRLSEPTDFPQIPSIAGGDPSIACRALTGLGDYRQWHSSFTAAQVLATIKGHSVDGRTTTPMVAWTHGTEPFEGAYSSSSIVANHAYSILGWMERLVPIRRLPFGDVVRTDVLDGIDVSAGDEAIGIGLRPVGTDLDLPYPLPLPRPLPLPLPWPPKLDLPRYRRVTYVVLRNPWGSTPGTGTSTTSGTYRARDIDWWRDVQLGTNGVFALEIGAYHRLYAGTGGAH